MKELITLIAIIAAAFLITRLIVGGWPWQETPEQMAINHETILCNEAGGVLDIMAGCIKKSAFINP